MNTDKIKYSIDLIKKTGKLSLQMNKNGLKIRKAIK